MACRRLRHAPVLADVATGVGFYDQSALNKHFKRCYGITPTQFARAAAAQRRCLSGAGTFCPTPLRSECQFCRYRGSGRMHLFCHEQPEILTVQTDVADARPGKVALAQSPFYPGGGGQLADRGVIRWQGGEAKVVGFDYSAGKLWHLLDGQSDVTGAVEAAVDPTFRRIMRELHTDPHIVNALVYQSFNGALVTGVQMNDDGTARIDFDVHGADNDRLRALEARSMTSSTRTSR